MEKFHIETAQNITIQQSIAPLTTRIGAFIIDMLIVGLYMVVVYLIISAMDFNTGAPYIMFYLVLGLPAFLYSLLFETLNNGQTIGKNLSSIRVTKLDGSKPTFGNFLVRWVLRMIDINLASGSIALFTILLNGKGQRLGDIAAGTTVISENKNVTIEDTLSVDLPDNYVPTYPQVTLLNDSDVQTIKELYQKAIRKGNHNTILKLSDRIIKITGITTEMKPTKFVNTVIQDYNYYTQQM
jgi:uncharacterized RDD family membrane protein YckC